MDIEDLSYLQKQNQQLRDRLSIVEAELQNKTRRMNKIQNDANSMHRQYEELLSRIIELQQNEENLVGKAKECDEAKQRYQNLFYENQQKDKIINQKDQEINDLKKQIENFSIKLDAQNKLIEAKNQEINDLNSNYELNQSELTRCKKNCSDLQNQLEQEKINNQFMSSKLQNFEEVIDLYKSQASSFQIIKEQNQSDLQMKDVSIENLKKEKEKLQLKCQDLENLIKNSTHILTNSDEDLNSSSFLKILNEKISKPKRSSICTQSDNASQDDESLSSSSFINQEVFPFVQNQISKKKLSSEIKAQFNKEKERVKNREKKKKAEAARKLIEIKDQFQTDLSLEQIIDMHNKLWQEENQQQTFLVRKNQKCF